MSIIIKPVHDGDFKRLAEFEKEISIISFGNEAITDIDFHERRIRNGFEKNSGGMFVMADGDILCGWLWMDKKMNYLTQETYINFRSFYVSEQYRGSAWSAALMEHGMEYCKNVKAKSIIGKVHTQNTQMRALYKCFGFKATHLTMEYVFPEDKNDA